ncbi:MAG: hypothetical protein ACI81G_001723, partial [Gammaproteobacteria bacterium]
GCLERSFYCDEWFFILEEAKKIHFSDSNVHFA